MRNNTDNEIKAFYDGMSKVIDGFNNGYELKSYDSINKKLILKKGQEIFPPMMVIDLKTNTFSSKFYCAFFTDYIHKSVDFDEAIFAVRLIEIAQCFLPTKTDLK